MSKILNTIKYGRILHNVNDSEKYLEFRDPLKAKEWGTHYYAKWAQTYSRLMKIASHSFDIPNMISPIERYCGYTFRHINAYLRNNIDTENNSYREASDFLSFVLCSAPRIPCNVVVYRLVCDEFIEKLIENNKCNPPTPTLEKGFMSTSLTQDIVKQPEHYSAERNLLKIFVPKGTMGIYVNNICHRNEEEILLRPNLYLGLSSYPYIDISMKKTIYECRLFNVNHYPED